MKRRKTCHPKMVRGLVAKWMPSFLPCSTFCHRKKKRLLLPRKTLTMALPLLRNPAVLLVRELSRQKMTKTKCPVGPCSPWKKTMPMMMNSILGSTSRVCLPTVWSVISVLKSRFLPNLLRHRPSPWSSISMKLSCTVQ